MDASVEHRQATSNAFWQKIRELCNILDRTYDYVLPRDKEEFNAWQRLYRSPHERPHLNANTHQKASDTEAEQLLEQEITFQDIDEAITDDAVLDGLRGLEDFPGNMVPWAFLHDATESLGTTSTSDDEPTTLEDVFQLEDEEEDNTLDRHLSWEDMNAALENRYQLDEGYITLNATSRSDDESLPSNYMAGVGNWTSELEGETSGCSPQPEDGSLDLNSPPLAVEANSTLDIAPQPEQALALDDVPQQDPIIPEATWDRMPGLLKAKLERNTVCEHLLTMMNQPSLKPTVRRTQPVPQDYQETYDNAVIRIEELKSLWHCIRETQRIVDMMKKNHRLAEKGLRIKFSANPTSPMDVQAYRIQRMKSKGQASRLNECIGIDDPWPEGE